MSDFPALNQTIKSKIEEHDASRLETERRIQQVMSDREAQVYSDNPSRSLSSTTRYCSTGDLFKARKGNASHRSCREFKKAQGRRDLTSMDCIC